MCHKLKYFQHLPIIFDILYNLNTLQSWEEPWSERDQKQIFHIEQKHREELDCQGVCV